jgi:hypothetical protein
MVLLSLLMIICWRIRFNLLSTPRLLLTPWLHFPSFARAELKQYRKYWMRCSWYCGVVRSRASRCYKCNCWKVKFEFIFWMNVLEINLNSTSRKSALRRVGKYRERWDTIVKLDLLSKHGYFQYLKSEIEIQVLLTQILAINKWISKQAFHWGLFIIIKIIAHF